MKNYLLLPLALLFLATSVLAADLAPAKVVGASTIGTVTAKMLFDKGFVFIDVRRAEDFNSGHIPGARHLAINSENFTVGNLSAIVRKDQAVVFYCNGVSCKGSSIASEKAVAWGWSKVLYYREGWPQWKEAGLAVEQRQPHLGRD